VYRIALRVPNYVCRAPVTACGLTIPDGDDFINQTDKDFASCHVSL